MHIYNLTMRENEKRIPSLLQISCLTKGSVDPLMWLIYLPWQPSKPAAS